MRVLFTISLYYSNGNTRYFNYKLDEWRTCRRDLKIPSISCKSSVETTGTDIYQSRKQAFYYNFKSLCLIQTLKLYLKLSIIYKYLFIWKWVVAKNWRPSFCEFKMTRFKIDHNIWRKFWCLILLLRYHLAIIKSNIDTNTFPLSNVRKVSLSNWVSAK